MLICENPIKELDENEKVSPLLTQLSWTNHLKIMSGSKSPEERRFSNCANLQQNMLICKYSVKMLLQIYF